MVRIFTERPIVAVSTTSYLVFCFLGPLGILLKPLLGEIADVGMMSVFLWPYPLLLSLQQWIKPGSGLSGFAADVFGLFVVVVFSFYVQRYFGYARPSGWRVYAWSLWIWYPPLLLLQGIVLGIAYLSGFPVGE